MSVRPTAAERAAALPGDDLVVSADPADLVVMDRGFSLPAPPAEVWPWLVQLGKKRGGWYFPAWIERLEPPGRRGLRRIEPAFQRHEVGDVIPDWGGADATFTLTASEPERLLLYTSTRGRTSLSWALVLSPEGAEGTEGTGSRLHLRLRLAPVRHRRLAELAGGFFDWATILGLAAGLRERVS